MVSNSDVNTMCLAIQKQLDLNVLPAWNLKSGSVKFVANERAIPGYSWVVYIIDTDAQVQGALGYHEELSDKIDGYIMCQPILSNGGSVLAFDPSNPGQYTVSATLSHEVIEMCGNRGTNIFCDNGDTSWCNELCDPCEQIGFGVMVGSTNVSVSDFVFPSFFNPYGVASTNSPFNYLNTLTSPFSILSGGYAIQRTGGPGTETQVFGEAMPQWRRDVKKNDLSRFSRITK
jgi:hypothetical protein